MKTSARLLTEIIDAARPRLLAIPEEKASAKPYQEKWSIKEILGHLADSESNNHQRIVRMQEKPDIGTFTYSQKHWVQSQRYGLEPWEDLVNLWYFSNKHLAHVLAEIDPGSLNNTCDMGYSKPASLQFVVEDYIRHVQHHLGQIFSDADPRERTKWARGE